MILAGSVRALSIVVTTRPRAARSGLGSCDMRTSVPHHVASLHHAVLLRIRTIEA